MSEIHNIPPTPRQHTNLPTQDTHISEGEEEAFDLSGFLGSVHYPASKEDLMDYASDQGLPDEILDMIEQLPDTTYNSPTDVSQAIGENAEIY